MPKSALSNRIAYLLVFALALPVAARADEASHRAKAQEMMDLLHTETMVRQVSSNIMKQISEVADKTAGSDASPEAKAKVADFEKQASQVIEAQVGWKIMQPQLVDIYTKSFSEDELDAIILFYKSPAGTTLLAKMPDVNDQVQKFGVARVQAMQPQLQQLFADFRKNIAPPPPTLGPTVPAPAAPSTPPTATPK